MPARPGQNSRPETRPAPWKKWPDPALGFSTSCFVRVLFPLFMKNFEWNSIIHINEIGTFNVHIQISGGTFLYILHFSHFPKSLFTVCELLTSFADWARAKRAKLIWKKIKERASIISLISEQMSSNEQLASHHYVGTNNFVIWLSADCEWQTFAEYRLKLKQCGDLGNRCMYSSTSYGFHDLL